MNPPSPIRYFKHAVLRGVIYSVIASVSLAWGQQEDRLTGDIFVSEEKEKREKKEVASEADGVPFSTIIRDTEPPYTENLRDLTFGGTEMAKLGPSGSALFHANFFNKMRFRTPFSEKVRPEDAELKFRNFYVDVTSVSAGAIYSDNINRSDSDKEDGVIAFTRLNFGLMYQLGENLRIAVKSAVIYLPLQNRIGIVGLGLGEPLIEFFPLAEFRMSYDLTLSDWKIEFFDEAAIHQRPLGAGLDADILEGQTFDQQDIMGRYRTQTANDVFSGTQASLDSRFGNRLIHAHNTVGVKASRLLPAQTEMTIGASHRNNWYKLDDDAPSVTALPGSQDMAFVDLVSERESLRFKPFAHHRIYKSDLQEKWNQMFRGGVRGPITDYIFFLGDVGFHDGRGSTHFLWRARLEHNPTPYLLHRLEYSREVTDPVQQLLTGWTYQIRYKLGDNLTISGVGAVQELEDLETDSPRADELRGGAIISYRAGESPHISVTGLYTKFGYENPIERYYDIWTGRLRINYQISANLSAQLLYQYETRDSTTGVPVPYGENLVMGQLIKFF